jgi:anti-sigma regulatory factor (Ser/Thr protein kinase)
MKEEFESAKKWVEENEFCRFEGEINSGERLKSFLQNLENYLKEIGTELTIMRRIFSVTVEIALNIRSHAEKAEGIPNFQHEIIASIFDSYFSVIATVKEINAS